LSHSKNGSLQHKTIAPWIVGRQMNAAGSSTAQIQITTAYLQAHRGASLSYKQPTAAGVVAAWRIARFIPAITKNNGLQIGAVSQRSPTRHAADLLRWRSRAAAAHVGRCFVLIGLSL